jgi:hypothetical protein
MDEVTLRAVGNLLMEGRRVGIGLWFGPTEEQGWFVNYMDGHHGGPLGEGSTLLAAATATMEKLRQGWPYDRDDVRGRAFVVILPDRTEAIAWDFDDERYIRCVARNVNGKRCANGIFDDQPGKHVKLFGGPGGSGYFIDDDRNDYGRRADLQRCALHLDRDNPDAAVHEGQRFQVTKHTWDTATLR